LEATVPIPATDRPFYGQARAITFLAICACAITALAFSASPAVAAATLVGQSPIIGQLEIDGDFVYWSDGRKLTRTNINSSLGNTVYRAPKGTRITAVEAGGGRLAFTTLKPGKRSRKSTAYIFDSASGATSRIASGSEKIKKREALCGSSLSLGNVTATGEALLIKSTFSFNKKFCKKPISVRSSVTGFAPGGLRLLFSGNAAIQGDPLSQLFDLYSADLNGNRLLLSGFGIGVFDIASQQFTLLASQRRTDFVTGAFDQYGNVLISRSKDKLKGNTFSLLDGLSGFTNTVPVETGSGSLSYRTCGGYLQRANYAFKRNELGGIKVNPNPLKPEGLLPSVPMADSPTTQTLLWDEDCDATRSVWAVSSATNVSKLQIFVAPLTG
jgi:hypothetical protein